MASGQLVPRKKPQTGPSVAKTVAQAARTAAQNFLNVRQRFQIATQSVQTRAQNAQMDTRKAPIVAQSVRKAPSKGLRPAFALVEKKFKELDGLILQFGKTEAGKAMIAAWKDARIQKGQGSGGDDEEKKPAEPVKPA